MLRVWDSINCRWVEWTKGFKAWKALPHAVIGAGCILGGGGGVAAYKLIHSTPAHKIEYKNTNPSPSKSLPPAYFHVNPDFYNLSNFPNYYVNPNGYFWPPTGQPPLIFPPPSPTPVKVPEPSSLWTMLTAIAFLVLFKILSNKKLVNKKR